MRSKFRRELNASKNAFTLNPTSSGKLNAVLYAQIILRKLNASKNAFNYRLSRPSNIVVLTIQKYVQIKYRPFYGLKYRPSDDLKNARKEHALTKLNKQPQI